MARPAANAQKYLNVVKAELQNEHFRDAETSKALASLKAIARTPQDAECVYSPDGISSMAEVAFDSKRESRPGSSLEAGRILANALLLQDRMQQVLADTGCVDRIVDFYNEQDSDHEFVGGRIIFLLTYKSKVDFALLVKSRNLVGIVQAHLTRHTCSITKNEFTGRPMHAMALTETLKLFYNLVSKYPGLMHYFSNTVETMIEIVRKVTPSPTGPLDPPVTQILNALAIIEWPTSVSRGERKSMQKLAESLIHVTDLSTSTLKPAQLETMLIPLITVLRKLYKMSTAPVKESLRVSLLPQDAERDKPLGQSKTLASRLLRLQTSGGLTILPEAVSALLFDLSDRDATTFVHNIGYGHAAGFLMTHKIPIPEDLKTTTSGSSTSGSSAQINPITGQRLDAETPVTMPEMSDAEKEKEAERLFVLFERLRATGVMNVENPVTVAQQSGRFEELSDSEPD